MRTAPLPLLFDAVYQQLRSQVKRLDVLVLELTRR